jgi:hypothetical protein
LDSTEAEAGSGPSGIRQIAIQQMRDFDRFTMMIAEGDPIKVSALERGTVRLYWDTAEAYMNRLLNAKKMADKARSKHG